MSEEKEDSGVEFDWRYDSADLAGPFSEVFFVDDEELGGPQYGHITNPPLVIDPSDSNRPHAAKFFTNNALAR